MAETAAQKLPPLSDPSPGDFKPGYDPRRNTNGRKKKSIKEIEDMLDDEFRTVESMREAFTVLRKLAVQGVTKDVWYKGEVVGQETEYSEPFMALFFNRLLGPVKEQVTEEDLSGLTDEEVAGVREKLVKLGVVK